MFTTLRTKTVSLFALLAVLTLIGVGASRAPAQDTAATPAAPARPAITISAEDAIAQVTADDGTLRFDVAEDVSRFVFAGAPVFDDGMPAHGNPFITQGYIYPEGTLDGSNGTLADGSPEFPELVLGQWTCRGWFVGDGAHTTTGPMVITTQIYSFGSEPGAATLVTDGYELVDTDVEVGRAITGGTGPYAGARGEASQTLLGFTEQMSVNLRFALPVVQS